MNTKKRILLVEDDPNFGIILRDFLKMNEYDVILAKNGMEGFEKFKKFDRALNILGEDHKLQSKLWMNRNGLGHSPSHACPKFVKRLNL